MNKRITTRRAVMKGLVSSAAVTLAGCSASEPPTYGNVLRMGDWVTYNAHRLLLPRQSLAREYDLRDISAAPAIGTTDPTDPSQGGFIQEFAEDYARLLRDAFGEWRLTVEGSVAKPSSFSLEDLKRMSSRTQITRHACEEGWSAIMQWTGVPLRAVLERAGLTPGAREVVFFGADRGEEEVEFRVQKYKVEQQYGRSLARDIALSAEPFLAYALNGAPLTRHQGAPLRLIVPGWYGAPNVKWLSEIHAQEDQYLGKFQARWYRTLRGEMVDGEMKWKETAITRMQLKSFVARVTFDGSRHRVLGVILHDGTPIESVEVRVDDGPWQRATLDPATRQKYSWKLFTWTWSGATPGEHTIVSRVTDATGTVQPTAEELETKKTFLEDNSQFPRTLRVG